MAKYITTNKELSELKEGQIVWFKRNQHYGNQDWKKIVITRSISEHARGFHYADYDTGRTDYIGFSEPHYDGYFKLEEFYDKETSLCAIPRIIATNQITDGREFRTEKPKKVKATEQEIERLTKIGRVFVKLNMLNVYRHKSFNSLKNYEYTEGYNLWNPLSWIVLFVALISDLLGDGFNNFSFKDFIEEIRMKKYFPHNIEKVYFDWKDI